MPVQPWLVLVGLALACCVLRFCRYWILRLTAAELSHIPCPFDRIATCPEDAVV